MINKKEKTMTERKSKLIGKKVKFQTRFGMRKGIIKEVNKSYSGTYLKVEEETGKDWWIRKEQ